jgi:integrase
VPLSPAALVVLGEQSFAAPDPDGLVFPGPGGRPLSDMAFEDLLRRAGGEDITTHGFRSSFRDLIRPHRNRPAAPPVRPEFVAAQDLRQRHLIEIVVQGDAGGRFDGGVGVGALAGQDEDRFLVGFPRDV